MKSFKNVVYIILSFLLVGLIISGIICYDNKMDNTFVNKDHIQKQSDKAMVTDFESGKTKTLIVMLYKTTCPVCEDKQYSINSELSNQKAPVVYVNATKGLPNWLKEKVSPNVFQGAKTPYVLVLKDKNFKPIFAERLDTDSNIKILKKKLD